METDAGDWTDRSFADVQSEAPELFEKFFTGAPSFAFPGGESFAQQEVRVDAALCDIEARSLPALVVCHGMVIRAALSSAPANGCRTASACRTARSCRSTPRRRSNAPISVAKTRRWRAEELFVARRATSAAPSRAMRERGTTRSNPARSARSCAGASTCDRSPGCTSDPTCPPP